MQLKIAECRLSNWGVARSSPVVIPAKRSASRNPRFSTSGTSWISASAGMTDVVSVLQPSIILRSSGC